MPDQNQRDPRALNAYRHGLTGQIVIRTPAEQVAYDRHCRAIHDSLRPAPGMETELAQSICDGRWRLKRAAAIEEAIFALELDEPGTAGQEDLDHALALARAWRSTGKSLQLLTLYESRIQRRVEKDLAMLRGLQQDRKLAGKSPSAVHVPATKAKTPVLEPAGFVFSGSESAPETQAGSPPLLTKLA